MSVAELQAELAGAGFELTAPLARDVYDAHVAPAWRCARVRPSCRTVLVVGSGGRGFWSCLARAPEARDPEHPADRYTRRVLEQAAWRAAL